jgi:16S rRNA (uracil1498-N3)-methyltransferase
MHRFFVPPDAIVGGEVRFPEPAARQIERVLRLRPSDGVVVLDGQGMLYRVTLRRVERSSVQGEVSGREIAAGEPGMRVVLYAALLKGEHFEWTLQKGTELGVARFVPLVTERTVMRDLAPSSTRQARWERIVQEAAEQSERSRLPVVAEPMTFAGACAQAAEVEVGLIAWEEERRRTLAAAWGERRPRSVAVWIGPEGGFAADEVELACAHGIIPFSLGPRVMRADTAALVAVTLMMERAGELLPAN